MDFSGANSLPKIIPAQLMRQRSVFSKTSSFYMCSPTVGGVTEVLSMFRAGHVAVQVSQVGLGPGDQSRGGVDELQSDICWRDVGD